MLATSPPGNSSLTRPVFPSTSRPSLANREVLNRLTRRTIFCAILIAIGFILNMAMIRGGLPSAFSTLGLTGSTVLLGWRYGIFACLLTALIASVAHLNVEMMPILMNLTLVWTSEKLARAYAFRGFINGIFSAVSLASVASLCFSLLSVTMDFFHKPVGLFDLVSAAIGKFFEKMILMGFSSELATNFLVVTFLIFLWRALPKDINFFLSLRRQRPPWESNSYYRR